MSPTIDTRRLPALLVLVAAATAGLSASPAHAVNLPAGTTALLSGQSSLFESLPTPAGESWTGTESTSHDGRFTVFLSTADGLTDEDDDRVRNVYVKDRETGAVELVSRATGPTGEPAGAHCSDAAISDNGLAIAFACDAALDPADRNGFSDVYVRRLDDGTTQLASRVGAAGATGNGASRKPSISASGRDVAFESYATNFDAGTTTDVERVYRRRLDATPSTVLVSRKATSDGGAPVQGTQPSIDDSGDKVAFQTPEALVGDDTNSFTDVYVRHVDAGQVELISRAHGDGAVGNSSSFAAAISSNGRGVAFQSYADNLDERDTDRKTDVFLRTRAGVRPTTLASVNDTGVKGEDSRTPSINSDGTLVGFLSDGKLHPADTDSDIDAYVTRPGVGEADLVSRTDGSYERITSEDVIGVGLSGDGTKATAALKSGGNPAETDTRYASVILRDLASTPRRTYTISRPAGSGPFENEGGHSHGGALSADGRYAAFTTRARGLGLGTADVHNAVAVRDRVTGEVQLVSRKDGPGGALFSGGVEYPAISADGRRVAFSGRGPERGIWVRDLQTGRTWLASRAGGENGDPANSDSWEPALDADGSRVAFISAATNISLDDTDTKPDLYVRDITTGETILASRADGAGGAKANRYTETADINGDGSRVAFVTPASNLGDGDTNPTADVHVRDLAANTTRLVSATPDGAPGNDESLRVSIDAAGNRIAFLTSARNLPDGGFIGDKVYVRDLAANTITLVSRGAGRTGTPVHAEYPTLISPDGTHAAFATTTALQDGLPPVAQAYLRNIDTGENEVISRRPDGSPASETVWPADVSAGGGCVTLEGRNLTTAPNENYEVYLRAVRANCGDPEPSGPGTGGGTDGGSGTDGPGRGGSRPSVVDRTAPVVTGARLSRKRFRVARGATAVSAATGRGTVLRFRSSEAGTVTVRFERVLPGKRVGSRCRVVKKRPKRGACTIYKRAGSLTRTVRAGEGKIALTGRLGRKAMASGAYRLTLTATDGAGNASKPVRVSFAIVRG